MWPRRPCAARRERAKRSSLTKIQSRSRATVSTASDRRVAAGRANIATPRRAPVRRGSGRSRGGSHRAPSHRRRARTRTAGRVCRRGYSQASIRVVDQLPAQEAPTIFALDIDPYRVQLAEYVFCVEPLRLARVPLRALFRKNLASHIGGHERFAEKLSEESRRVPTNGVENRDAPSASRHQTNVSR